MPWSSVLPTVVTMELSGNSPIRITVAAVVIAFLASGCGSSLATSNNRPANAAAPAETAAAVPISANESGTDADAPACHLLSAADVTTAMGQPMQVVAGVGAAVCAYAAVADPSVLLQVQVFASLADAAVYTQVESSSEHVAGLGDDAFWNPTLDIIFVSRGERCFIIVSPSLANLTSDPQAPKAAMVQLATTVLASF
jgi:hypothetical protein